MSYFNPHPSNAELVSIADAYHIVWGAGNIALREASVAPEVKAQQGEEIHAIFDRLDQVRDDASAILPALPESELPLISLGSIVEPLTNKINDIYAEHGVGPDRKVSPFRVHDDRITALMGLDIYIRRSKNNLFETRNPSDKR